MGASGNGLAAIAYSPNEVTTTVGNGVAITVNETTDYPFRDTIRMKCKSSVGRFFSSSGSNPVMGSATGGESERDGDRWSASRHFLNYQPRVESW